MNSSLFECTICMDRYDDKEHTPHLLSCGHTYCALCLTLLLKETKILCPQDRVEMAVSAVSTLAKNFALLDIVRATAAASSATPSVTSSSITTTTTTTTATTASPSVNSWPEDPLSVSSSVPPKWRVEIIDHRNNEWKFVEVQGDRSFASFQPAVASPACRSFDRFQLKRGLTTKLLDRISYLSTHPHLHSAHGRTKGGGVIAKTLGFEGEPRVLCVEYAGMQPFLEFLRDEIYQKFETNSKDDSESEDEKVNSSSSRSSSSSSSSTKHAAAADDSKEKTKSKSVMSRSKKESIDFDNLSELEEVAEEEKIPAILSVIIGNLARKKNATHHFWRMYVQPLFDDKLIKEVSMELHPSFPNPICMLKEAPFELSGQAYGTFAVKVVLYPSSPGGRPAAFEHMLSFEPKSENTVAIPASTFAPLRAVIRSPAILNDSDSDVFINIHVPSSAPLLPGTMVVRCTATKLDENYHAFKVSVHLSPGQVKSVVMELHPSFPNPVRTFSQPPYEISGRAWGTFPVKITVVPHSPHTPKTNLFPLQFSTQEQTFSLWS